MKNVKRILPFTISMLLCVGLFSCSDNVTFEWGNFRSDRTIAGFIDDSLVVVTDCRRWHRITETWNGGYSEESSCGHDRMMVYNYRVQEDGPRWMDSLTNESDGGYWKQLTNSSIWRWDGDSQEKLKLWEIGKDAREIKLKKKNERCSGDFEINRMHQWLGENFIALGNYLSAGGDSCQYAVLDTIERTLTYKRLDKNLEWIEKCDDVRAWGNDVYCVILNKENEASIILKNEKILTSSTIFFYIGGFWGNMIKLNGNICSLVNDEITCSDVTWRGTLMFYKDGIVVVDLGKEL